MKVRRLLLCADDVHLIGGWCYIRGDGNLSSCDRTSSRFIWLAALTDLLQSDGAVKLSC